MSEAGIIDSVEANLLSNLPTTKDAVPYGMATADGRRDARRFAIYRNNMASSLHRALEQRFPVTRRIVGGDFFRFVTSQFTDVHRPVSPLMFLYGQDFPAFLSKIEEASHLSYLPDVARLEWLLGESYHAADADALTLLDLQTLDLSDKAVLSRLAMHPACRLLASSYPVGEIWIAHHAHEVAPLAESGPQNVLVCRVGETVAITTLSSDELAFAEAFQRGSMLEEAAIAAFENHPFFDFGGTLVRLTTAGALTRLESTEEDAR